MLFAVPVLEDEQAAVTRLRGLLARLRIEPAGVARAGGEIEVGFATLRDALAFALAWHRLPESRTADKKEAALAERPEVLGGIAREGAAPV
ncbi:hypothetical protein OPKNFCMD_4319 [Methylobacterium crusticola]|uniref:Uncharacterized protein n=1 Tax=Methylobacterium crusticola TaxID=1697972 RepID=A0ABQ4R329_9HYPH|nr:hypothetical protein [Methylobacterium crusticola]GJD51564.1 hypothetical protein OPKNFCMD_4319 [Methylobacterium crusticola]